MRKRVFFFGVRVQNESESESESESVKRTRPRKDSSDPKIEKLAAASVLGFTWGQRSFIHQVDKACGRLASSI